MVKCTTHIHIVFLLLPQRTHMRCPKYVHCSDEFVLFHDEHVEYILLKLYEHTGAKNPK